MGLQINSTGVRCEESPPIDIQYTYARRKRESGKSIRFSVNLYCFLPLFASSFFLWQSRVLFRMNEMRGNAGTTRVARGKKLMKCSRNVGGFAPRSIATERNRKEERGRARKRFTRPITILRRRERWAVLSHKRSAQRNRSFPLYLVTILSNHLISP